MESRCEKILEFDRHCKHVVTRYLNFRRAVTINLNRFGGHQDMIPAIAGAAVSLIGGGKGGKGNKGGGGGGPMELIASLVNKVKGAVTGQA